MAKPSTETGATKSAGREKIMSCCPIGAPLPLSVPFHHGAAIDDSDDLESFRSCDGLESSLESLPPFSSRSSEGTSIGGRSSDISLSSDNLSSRDTKVRTIPKIVRGTIGTELCPFDGTGSGAPPTPPRRLRRQQRPPTPRPPPRPPTPLKRAQTSDRDLTDPSPGDPEGAAMRPSGGGHGDNPATAAADAAASLPVTPPSVPAITDLLAHGEVVSAAASASASLSSPEAASAARGGCARPRPRAATPRRPGGGGGGAYSVSPEDEAESAAAIVRSIASYLSLSDAEGIGSVYSVGDATGAAGQQGRHAGSVLGKRRHSSRSFRTPRDRFGGGAGSVRSIKEDEQDLDRGEDDDVDIRGLGRSWDPDDDGGGGGDGAAAIAAAPDPADAAAGGAAAAAASPPCRSAVGRSRSSHSSLRRVDGSLGSAVSWATTPPTPGLIALSPQEEGWEDDDDDEDEDGVADGGGPTDRADGGADDGSDPEDEGAKRRLAHRHRQFVQQKLTAAVMSHPHSVRSYCLTAHRAAAEIQKNREDRRRALEEQREQKLLLQRQQQQRQRVGEGAPAKGGRDRSREGRRRNKERRQRVRIVRLLLSKVLDNVPLSVLLDVSECAFETSLQTTVAAGHLTARSVEASVGVLCGAVQTALGVAAGLNPVALAAAVLALHRDAACHASGALVSGIQSAAAGVGSAGAAAVHALSRGGGVVAGAHGMASARSAHTRDSAGGASGLGGGRSAGHGGSAGRFLSMLRSTSTDRNNVISDRLFRKLSRIDSTSKVISYLEREDEALTQHAKKRVQRMMHYHVSLRPFVATVTAPRRRTARAASPRGCSPPSLWPGSPLGGADLPGSGGSAFGSDAGGAGAPFVPSPRSDASTMTAADGGDESSSSSPFMCTPKSFPPTPTSRSHVLARGTRFADDVVFLARDRLRVQGGLESDNAQTRAMAEALRESSRLAVFNASDAGGGVALTCGYHCASKVGNDLYCSTRGMIPVLRNCYVYFEMSVSTPLRLRGPGVMHHTSVSVGLSTLEMPLNTLVGAWKGSVGLCTTGQILAAGQWCSPLDPRLSSYGSDSTVGCLVRLDDDSAFETWDGVVVTAVVTFNVNGRVVEPPAAIGGGGSSGSGLLRAGGGGDDDGGEGCEPDRDRRTRRRTAGAGATPPPPPARCRPASTLPLFVPREEELFPTLTLHSPETRVMCRFCAEDVLARSREEIGAPPGVTVFCVDGSVLLDEDEDVDELYPTDRSYRDEDETDVSDDSLDSLSSVDEDGDL